MHCKLRFRRAQDLWLPLWFAHDSTFRSSQDTPAALGRSEPCSRTIEDGTEDVHLGNAPTPDPSSSGKLQNCLEGSKPAAAKAVGLATDGGVATNTTNYSSAAGPTGTNGGGERRVDHQENGENIEDSSSPQKSPEAATAGAAGTAVVEPAEDTATADPLTVVAMRQELSLVKNAASGLEGALRESRSEVQLLRELLATEQDTTRKLRYPLVCTSQIGVNSWLRRPSAEVRLTT